MKCCRSSAVPAALLVVLMTACVRPSIRTVADGLPGADPSQLWEEPENIEQRNLLNGPGGAGLAPRTDRPFAFVEEDRTGFSRGYDVRDADGVEWSVKIGPEAQSEVAVSRLLWAVGFHQPPVYYIPSWTMTGHGLGLQPAGRFRPDLPGWDVDGEWSWYENAFVETRPFRGLIAANLLVNNWDWKTSNNRIYELESPERPTRRLYVVRDLGASLGKTAFPGWLNWFPMRGLGQGSRNNLEDFEAQRFIRQVDGERVEFDYRGIHQTLVDSVSRGDVVWVCRLFARLSERQLHDAFRAAGYPDDEGRRFVAKLRSKVAEGLALANGAAPGRGD